MAVTAERRKEIVAKHQVNPKDTGSCEVQVALLTERITELTGHLKTHPKDNHTRLGLTKMVAKRTRLLTYLRATEIGRYKTLIDTLGLRK